MRERAELLILQGARAFDASAGLGDAVDVVIERGVITRLGRDAAVELSRSPSARVIEAEGKWVLPGLIDLAAHLAEPGREHQEDIASGLRAAAAGGFTQVCCTPDTDPVNDSPVVTDWMIQRARSESSVALRPIAAATQGLRGEVLSEMGALRSAGAIAVGDGRRCITSSDVLRHVLEYSRDLQLPVFQHPEDHRLTDGAEMNEGATATRLGLRGAPAFAEDVIVARDVRIAEITQGRYHAARVSTARSVQALLQARTRGAKVSAAVPIHHLLLTEERLEDYDTRYKLSPPLRHRSDVEALLAAVEEGSVDAVISDHQPRVPSEKDCDMASAEPGAVGLSLCLSLALSLVSDGKLSLAAAVRALTSGPASVLGLPVPSVTLGEAADLVLVSPQEPWEVSPGPLHGKSWNSPFMGTRLNARVELTLAGGCVAFDRTEFEKTPRGAPS